jgi:hypothetical protein
LAAALHLVRAFLACLFIALALLILAVGSLWVSFVITFAEGPDDNSTEWSVWFFWPTTLILALIFGTVGLAAAGRLNEWRRGAIGAVASIIAVILVSALRLPPVPNAGLEVPIILGTDVAALLLTAQLLPDGTAKESQPITAVGNK